MKADQKEKVGYTTVRMSQVAHETIAKEAKRLGLKNIDYMDAAVRYFALRGLNPVEVEAREGTLIMQQIQRLGDRLFSYMQQEEQSILLPMLEELIRIRLTTERVLRLEEVMLSVLPEEELKRKKEKVEQLKQQNNAVILGQLQEVMAAGTDVKAGRKEPKMKDK